MGRRTLNQILTSDTPDHMKAVIALAAVVMGAAKVVVCVMSLLN